MLMLYLSIVQYILQDILYIHLHYYQYIAIHLSYHILVDSLIDYDQDALLNASEGVYGIVNADVDNQMMTAVRSAVNVIEEAFEKYK